MIKTIIFVLPCILITISIIKKIFFSSNVILGKRERIRQIGLRKQYLLTSIPSLSISVCFLMSYNYVEYRFLWIVIAVINIIGVIFVSSYAPLDKIAARLQKEAEGNSEYKSIIRKERRKILFGLIILILWIYSWRETFF
jgi:hypothetical protein